MIKENDMIKDKHISNLELMLKDKVGGDWFFEKLMNSARIGQNNSIRKNHP